MNDDRRDWFTLNGTLHTSDIAVWLWQQTVKDESEFEGASEEWIQKQRDSDG